MCVLISKPTLLHTRAAGSQNENEFRLLGFFLERYKERGFQRQKLARRPSCVSVAICGSRQLEPGDSTHTAVVCSQTYTGVLLLYTAVPTASSTRRRFGKKKRVFAATALDRHPFAYWACILRAPRQAKTRQTHNPHPPLAGWARGVTPARSVLACCGCWLWCQ